VKTIRRPSKHRFTSLVFARIVLCLFVLLPSAIAQSHPDASASAATPKLPQQKPSQKSDAVGGGCKPPRPDPFECPKPTRSTTSSDPIAALSAAPAHSHTVRLTWNANPSTPNSNSQTATAGYCLYRGTTRDIPSTILSCKTCERVNKVPLSDIGCIDEWTKAGATYYYVVAAINRCGAISSASNEAKAEIDEPSPKTVSEKDLRSCRKDDLK
jgi:hypothetical protein